MNELGHNACKGAWPPAIKTMTKGTRTKRAIVATAAPLFNVSGYAGTTISDILAATGLEKGGLYRHFKSKDELAIAAFDFAVKALERRHSLSQSTRRTATDRLLSSINVVANFIHRPPLRGGCPIMNTAIDANGTHEVLFLRAAKALRDWQSRVARMVDEGVASGELRPGSDGVAVAIVLTSSLEGALIAATLCDDPAQMACVAEHLRDLVRGLRRRRERSYRTAGHAPQSTNRPTVANALPPVTKPPRAYGRAGSKAGEAIRDCAATQAMATPP